mmetsp:Transcript_10241/g.9917  ORF Transcript_10241/g.9917 Transcript_10241/m.9917 type:complete len:781 (+) Transcript_10241:61-2403(+)
MVEMESGSIIIDGVDINTISLKTNDEMNDKMLKVISNKNSGYDDKNFKKDYYSSLNAHELINHLNNIAKIISYRNDDDECTNSSSNTNEKKKKNKKNSRPKSNGQEDLKKTIISLFQSLMIKNEKEISCLIYYAFILAYRKDRNLTIGEKSTNNKNIRFKILQCAYVIKRLLSILHISTILSYLSTYNAARTEVLTNEACTEVLTNDEMNGINMVNMELNDKGVNLSSPQSITNISSSPTDVRTPLDVRTPRDVLTPIDVRTSDVLTPVDVHTSHSTDVHIQSSGARTNETTVAPLFAQLVPRSPERTQYLHAHVVSPSPARAQYLHADAVDLFGHPNALLGEDQRDPSQEDDSHDESPSSPTPNGPPEPRSPVNRSLPIAEAVDTNPQEKTLAELEQAQVAATLEEIQEESPETVETDQVAVEANLRIPAQNGEIIQNNRNLPSIRLEERNGGETVVYVRNGGEPVGYIRNIYSTPRWLLFMSMVLIIVVSVLSGIIVGIFSSREGVVQTFSSGLVSTRGNDHYIGHNGNDNGMNVVSNLISYDPVNVDNEITYVSTHIGVHIENSDNRMVYPDSINSIEDESTYVSTTEFVPIGENNVIYADMYVSTTTGDDNTYVSTDINDDSEATESTFVSTNIVGVDVNINSGDDNTFDIRDDSVNGDIDIIPQNSRRISTEDEQQQQQEEQQPTQQMDHPVNHHQESTYRTNMLSRILHAFRHLHDSDVVTAGYTPFEEHSITSEEPQSEIEGNRNIFSFILRSFRHIHDQDLPIGYYNPDELD